MVRAGLKAIYLSGSQAAGDANLAGNTYPIKPIPVNSVPAVVRRMNNALLAPEIATVEVTLGGGLAGPDRRRRQAGFGGPLNV